METKHDQALQLAEELLGDIELNRRMIFPEGLPYNLNTNSFGSAKMSNLYALAGIKKTHRKPMSPLR